MSDQKVHLNWKMPLIIQRYKPDKYNKDPGKFVVFFYLIKTFLLSCVVYRFHLRYHTLQTADGDGESKTLNFTTNCQKFLMMSCEKEVDISFAYTL